MMKHLKLAAVTGALALMAGITPAGAAGSVPSSVSEAPQFFFNMEMLKRMDANKDGTVTRDEYMRYLGRQFDRMDVEKKGMLTARQFTDRQHMVQTFRADD